VDRFSFIFAFYGLILGLAVTEVLGGFADFARRHRIRDLGAPTALLALLVFVDICATWLDAWQTLRDVPLNFEGMLAPILTATFYYLAAAMVFPRDDRSAEGVEAYFVKRKGFVAVMLLAAEICITFTFMDFYRSELATRPAVFWYWHVPYKLLILWGLAALAFSRRRRVDLAAILFVLFLFVVPYWTRGALQVWVHEHFDTPGVSASRTPSASS